MNLLLSVFISGESSCVPRAANLAVSSSQRLRNPIGSLVMQAQAKSDPPSDRQRYVIPGQLDSLKSIVPLEFSQAIMLLFPIGEIRIP